MVSATILAGVGRPHKEIATLVVNPRTGKPIDDVNAAAAFPRRIVPLRQGEGRGQRRAWDAGTKPLGLGSVGRDHNARTGANRLGVIGRSQRRSSRHPRRGEGGVPRGRKDSRIVRSRFVNREHVSLGWCSGTNNILLACLWGGRITAEVLP